MRSLLISILMFVTVLSFGQYSIPSQFNRNLMNLNPAYTGKYDATVLSLMHRSNWIGYEGALSYQNLELHTPLKKQSVALGFQARHENIGSTNSNEVFFNYCHRMKMNDYTLSLSIKAGLQSKFLSDVNLESEIEDPAFSSANNMTLPNFGFGAAFYHEVFYVGLSVPYLLGSIAGSDGTGSIDFDVNRHSYILSAGGIFAVNNTIHIEPSAVYIYSLSGISQYAAIVNVSYKETFLVGLGYKSEKSMVFNVGYFLNRQISFMYAYDYCFGEIGSYLNGAHEIGLLYYWGYKVNMANPRDF